MLLNYGWRMTAKQLSPDDRAHVVRLTSIVLHSSDLVVSSTTAPDKMGVALLWRLYNENGLPFPCGAEHLSPFEFEMAKTESSRSAMHGLLWTSPVASVPLNSR
ncbi:hypothetical protein HPB50_005440 [Hyalomma asiaticum]|uniref:Uncharacterized protein n=1 Tax=Hyalomma asiaticum TaxID=266040 RepID=A0ACB7ST88_HYAAI|nr:hypothetical protein HPB50_005440 [Hyalomma asiaticum]